MRLARRIIVIWAIDALALWLLAQFVPGLELRDWMWAIWAVALIGLLNALVRPVLLFLMLPFTVLTLGLFSVLINAMIVLLADAALPGFMVADLLAAVWTVLGIAAINTVVTGLLSINDDESFYRNVVQRIARRAAQVPVTDEPGLIIIEIDGLSELALRRALDEGYMPTLARLVDNGSYSIQGWDCGLPSQTSSSQAGILYGRNFGIPAFRWYEKVDQRWMISNRPWAAAEIHRRISDGTGLLSNGGSSLTNLVSGDAARSVMTLSSLLDNTGGVRQQTSNYFLFFLNPYNFSRTLVLMAWEIIREIGQRFRAWIRRPRYPASRGGSFPLLRAMSNVFVRDLNLYLLMENMFSGTPVVYSTFLGYDVVAHHAGPMNRDTLLTLKHFDEQLHALQRASKQAPRPYHFVFLSDHGQSPGATFQQRYGLTIEQLIERGLEGRELVTGAAQDDESWGHLNALLTQAIQDESVAGRAARRALRRRTQDGYVDVGPAADELHEPEAEVVVCTSGNLALVYFTDTDERLTFEELTARYPRLIEALVGHRGIGFVQVRSAIHGAVVIGRRGVHYLERGEVEGDDPLRVFGPDAARQLLRLDSFPNVGDLLINSFYDPQSGEVAAFEELVGSHGGLGGEQTKAFILYPSVWRKSVETIRGPGDVHRLLRGWIHEFLTPPSSDDASALIRSEESVESRPLL
jgi:putative membrane protein